MQIPEGATTVTVEGNDLRSAVALAAEELSVHPSQVDHKLDLSHFRSSLGTSVSRSTVKVVAWAVDRPVSEEAPKKARAPRDEDSGESSERRSRGKKEDRRERRAPPGVDARALARGRVGVRDGFRRSSPRTPSRVAGGVRSPRAFRVHARRGVRVPAEGRGRGVPGYCRTNVGREKGRGGGDGATHQAGRVVARRGIRPARRRSRRRRSNAPPPRRSRRRRAPRRTRARRRTNATRTSPRWAA